MPLQSARTPRSNRKTIVIGFDFGTYSTKAVVRERRRRDGQIVKFDRTARGYTPHVSPSLVRLVDGELLFGTKALNSSGGQLFRSLKVSLLLRDGHTATTSSEHPDARTLAAAYFAWAFQQLRDKLKDYSDANVFLNVAAPMSHFEDPALKEKYLQIVQAAWRVSFADFSTPIRQGISIRDARSILSPQLEAPVMNAEERRFDVLPETIAPIVSLSLDPLMAPGMYMIIDTGAGTTEMSVFHTGGTGADQKVLCYCDETMLLGGNDLQLVEQAGEAERRPALNGIIEKLVKKYRRVWHCGYQLDSPNHLSRQRWKELTLVLSGGGTRHEVIAEHLTYLNPMKAWEEKETKLTVCRHVPGTLELTPDLDVDDRSMFAVANGLAVERQKWPLVFPTGQIEPLEPTPDVEDKPQGYWYL